MYLLDDFENIIAICSAIFSGISIIVTVLSMAMEKSLINQQEYIIIKMDIASQSVMANPKKYKKNIKKIKNSIAGICGLDSGLIEILKPRSISKGLRFECFLYVSHTDSKNNQYVKLFKEAKANGALAECIRDAWELSSVPNITNLKIKQVKSDDARNRFLSESIQMDRLKHQAVASDDDEFKDADDYTNMQIAVPSSSSQVVSRVSTHVVNDSMVDADGMIDEDEEKMIVEEETDMGPEPQLNGNNAQISVDGHIHDTRQATM